ncbi:MAG: hypothetical protein K6357_07215 [Elusimicrobiota bacterium]
MNVKNIIFILVIFYQGINLYAAHPLITDDTGVQGNGNFQLESNIEYGEDKEEGVKSYTFDFNNTISYGYNDKLDLVLNIPYTRYSGKSDVSIKEGGIGDISFERKYVFYKKRCIFICIKTRFFNSNR